MGAIKPHSTPTDKSSKWDASSVLKELSDPSVSALRYIHAWVDPDGDPGVKSSYKFPHHSGPSGSAVIAGVNNALARLPQANIPSADRKLVEAHLRKHRVEAGLEESMTMEEVYSLASSVALHEGYTRSEKLELVGLLTLQERGLSEIEDNTIQPIISRIDDLLVLAGELRREILVLITPEGADTPNISDKAPISPVEEFDSAIDLRDLSVLTEFEPEEASEVQPMKVRIKILEPGWGNKRDNHYYSPKSLRESAGVFAGVKMYETDHRDDETNNRTWVSTVLEVGQEFTESGAPIAIVGIHDPGFAKRVTNLKKLGLLDKLHCSIRARGTVRPYEENGRQGYEVLEIKEARTIDWVTKAGAGGHALDILEESEGEPTMKKQQEIEETEEEIQEAELEETAQEPLTFSQAKALIPKNLSLPEPTLARMEEQSFTSTEEVLSWVLKEVAYLKEITTSGAPVEMGTPLEEHDVEPSSPDFTETDAQAAYDKIFSQFGLPV